MSLGLLAQAERVGRYRHLELSCFAMLGARAPSCTKSDLSLFCYKMAAAHGYRAVLFEELLPVSVGLPEPDELSSPAYPEVIQALRNAVAGPEADLVSGVVEVLYASMLASFDEHIAACIAVSDGPVMRTLGRARADLEQRIDEARHTRGGRAPIGAPWQETSELVKRRGGLFGVFEARLS